MNVNSSPAFFSKGRRTASFKLVEKVPVSRDVLIIFEIVGAKLATEALTSLAGRGSSSQDLDGALLMSLQVSSTDMV